MLSYISVRPYEYKHVLGYQSILWKGLKHIPIFFSVEESLPMLTLLQWTSLPKACIGIGGGPLSAHHSLTEYNPLLPSAPIHLFLVNCSYLKFLEKLTIWKEKKSLVAVPFHCLFGQG